MWSCPWNEGRAEATYVFFESFGDLKRWWQSERRGIKTDRDAFDRCKAGKDAEGPWARDDVDAGRLACKLVGSPPRARFSWTDEDTLVGYRLTHNSANKKLLFKRWKGSTLDVVG